jgi:transposase-like protein
VAVKGVSMAAPKKYPDELRERAVRLYRTSNPRPTFRQLAEQLGVHHEALRNWVRQPRLTTANATTARPAMRLRSCAGCARKSVNCAGPTRS